MAIDTTFDDARRIRFHTVTGRLTYRDLRDALVDLYSDGTHAGYHVLWDLRGADLEELKSSELQAIAELVKRNWGTDTPARGALVATTDSAYGILRMYEQLLGESAHRQVQVFRDVASATNWVTGEAS